MERDYPATVSSSTFSSFLRPTSVWFFGPMSFFSLSLCLLPEKLPESEGFFPRRKRRRRRRCRWRRGRGREGKEGCVTNDFKKTLDFLVDFFMQLFTGHSMVGSNLVPVAQVVEPFISRIDSLLDLQALVQLLSYVHPRYIRTYTLEYIQSYTYACIHVGINS